MRRDVRANAACAFVLLGLLFSASGVAAQADQRKELERKAGVESREAEKRRAIEKKVGIEPAPKKPTEQPAAAPATAPTPAAAPASPTQQQSGKATPRGPDFDTQVYPVLMAKCGSCHKVGGSGGRSKLILSADVAASFEVARAQVDPSKAATSPLLRRGTGEKHAKAIASPSVEYDLFLKWIETGARRGNAAAKAAIADGQAKSAAVPQASVAAPVPAVPPAPVEPVPAETSAPADGSAAVQSAGVFFVPSVHQALVQGCASCHGADGMAASTTYGVDSAPLTHYASARRNVIPGDPDASALVAKARGEGHGAGVILSDGSPELQLLRSWIASGAVAEPSATDSSAAQVQPTAASRVTADGTQAATASATPGDAPHPHATMRGVGGDLRTMFGSGLPLFAGFRLNGRFDLNYERRDYRDQPLFKGGRNAIQVYHNFLFLSWQEKDSPLSFTAELITLQLWELAYRLSPKHWPVRLTAKAGKLLVPFGSDPLYHHNYGGLAAFDQRMLPIIWAREGVQLSTYARVGPFAFNHDLYAVAGHALRQQDAVLNLQSDLAALDDAQIAIGNRLGASYGPASLYYSVYYNDLRFDRRLVLQALDAQLWKLRGVPFLQDFTFSAGAMRADVTGGGSGRDYYHFASYFMVRYFPVDWLFIQYRQGIQNYDNRRGVIQDDTRWTVADASAHNVGVVARYHGLSFGVFHFWNLERADEVDDDFTRVSLAYEF